MSNYAVTVGETAYEIDIIADAETDSNITLTFLNPDGSAYLFTGKTLAMKARTRPGGTTIASLTSPSSGLAIASNVVTVTASWTAALQRLAFYDVVETTTATGKRKKLAKGALLVRGTMTV